MLVLTYEIWEERNSLLYTALRSVLDNCGHIQDRLFQKHLPDLERDYVTADDFAVIERLVRELDTANLVLRYRGHLSDGIKELSRSNALVLVAEHRHPADAVVAAAEVRAPSEDLENIAPNLLSECADEIIREFRSGFSSWFNEKSVVLYQYGTLQTQPAIMDELLSKRLKLNLPALDRSFWNEFVDVSQSSTDGVGLGTKILPRDIQVLIEKSLDRFLRVTRGEVSVAQARAWAHRTRKANKIRSGYADISASFKNIAIAFELASARHKRRYNRVALGFLYVTISSALWVFGLGLVGAALFDEDPMQFIPYVAVGIVTWQILANMIASSAQVYITGAGLALDTAIPKSTFALSHVISTGIATLYRLPALLLVLLFSANVSIASVVWSLLGLFLILLFGFGLSLGLGPLCARYRDLREVVELSLQLLFFLSATFWRPEALGEFERLLNYNPLFHFINMARAPVIGVDWLSIVVACSVTIVTLILGVVIFDRSYKRLVYWIST